MGLYDYTTKEILNKVFRTSGGNSVAINDGTAQERLNAVLDDANASLRVSLNEQYVVFCHNFAQDGGNFNSPRYYPWNDETESTSPSDVESIFWAPYNMVFVKFLHRYSDLSGAGAGTDIDFKIRKMEDGSTTAVDVATMLDFTVATAAQDYIFESTADDFTFSGSNLFSKGDGIMISINPDSHLGAGTDKYYATSVWKVDLTS